MTIPAIRVHDDADLVVGRRRAGCGCSPTSGCALPGAHARRPGKPWRLDKLARAAAMSRTSFAERFRTLAGVPALTYLNSWRMLLAQRALRDGDTRVGPLAFELGYTSESVFSNAFKREVRHVADALPRQRPRRVGGRHAPSIGMTRNGKLDERLADAEATLDWTTVPRRLRLCAAHLDAVPERCPGTDAVSMNCRIR